MKRHLNTLYLTTPGAYLRAEGECIQVRYRNKDPVRVPINGLASIVAWAPNTVSSGILRLCGTKAVPFFALSRGGRIEAQVHGITRGNVLVRRTQYRWTDDPTVAARVARGFVFSKLHNCRHVLRRALRDHAEMAGREDVEKAVGHLGHLMERVMEENDLDRVRGFEGDGARKYFAVFGLLLTTGNFAFEGRNRRPPRDPVNAVLSFLYSLLTIDAHTAVEASGLDPQVGFLHRDRPGRPGLALDLVEEFRPAIADRIALTLFNRGQLNAKDFERSETGAVWISDKARKTVIVAYQERKADELRHPFTTEKITVGLVPFVQARLLNRVIRGDIEDYPPFLWR